MSSLTLRETIWLHVKAHPGITVTQVEHYLSGMSAGTVMREMYDERTLDRVKALKECGNVAGRTMQYAYTAVGEAYVDRGYVKRSHKAKRKPQVTVNPSPLTNIEDLRPPVPVQLPIRHKMLVEIRQLSFNDVMHIRNELNKWMAAA